MVEFENGKWEYVLLHNSKQSGECLKNKGSILLVEDDIVDHMLVKRAFKEIGITNSLIIISNGEAALDFLKDRGSEKPCIILLDLNMPGLDGVGALEALCDSGHGASVVVVTADIQSTSRARCLALGAHEVLNKPLDEVALRALLAGLLPAAAVGPAQPPA